MLVALGLAGCATTDTHDETRGWTVERLYSEAREELNSGNYSRAVKLYETLEARYPYGRFAQQAQMDLAYTHYKDNEPELAIAAADRFIKLHPTHPNLDYLYYLKGLVYYNDDSGLLSKWAGQDMSERDPKATREAFIAFREEVVSRRTKFLLRKARDRAHILVGLAIAVANIDEVIHLIRHAKDPSDAREKLMTRNWPAKDVAPLIALTLWMGVYPQSFLSFFTASVSQMVQEHQAAMQAASRLAGL